jgi:signal transduction histidine kinase
MYEYQYLASAILSLSVSIYISRRAKTLPLKILILFGLAIAAKGTFTFFSMTAPNQNASAEFFTIMVIFTRLGYPLYLLTFLNIPQRRGRKSLMLTIFPLFIDIAAIIHPDYSANFQMVSTEFGWTHRTVQINLLLAIDSIVFLGYMVAIIIGLFTLVRKTSFPSLRRKYTVFFTSFIVLQVFGILLTNTLITLNLLSPIFQLAGISHFLTFLSIWYALSLKEKAIPLSLIGKDFARVYSSFLTVYYNSVIGSQLGEESFKFTDFIRESKIKNQVLLAENEIIYRETEDLDLAELINRDLDALAEGRVDDEVIDQYLRVLNSADQELGWRFEEIVKANEDFLKRFDLIYGISEGRFLERIVKDESLRDLSDIDACLKIYKRILLQIMNRIKENTEFRKKLSEHYVTSAMKITDYGEVSMKGVKDRVLSMPRDQRLSFIVERFNSILSWAYEALLADPNADIEEILRKLRLVLTLNEDRAVELGIYPTLLGTLATKIPRTQVHRLYSDYLEELVEERTEELKKTQQELLKSQRLAAIGEAAAMVGHDLRNPLQAIVNMMYLTKEKLNSTPLQGSELLKLTQTVEEQVRYMNKIVSDLEDYARPLKVELAPTDLHKLINETLSNIKVPDTVEVSVMIEDDFDFPKLIVDPALMKRVLINLITNALQAMPDGGFLKIVAKRTEDSAFISIQDTGVGIPEENMDSSNRCSARRPRVKDWDCLYASG